MKNLKKKDIYINKTIIDKFIDGKNTILGAYMKKNNEISNKKYEILELSIFIL